MTCAYAGRFGGDADFVSDCGTAAACMLPNIGGNNEDQRKNSVCHCGLHRGPPIKGASCRVVFVWVQEGAVVGGIDRKGAVVSPTMERVELHAAAVHKDQRSEQGTRRICGRTASHIYARKHVMTRSAEAQREVADFIHRDAAQPIAHVGIDHRGLLVNEPSCRITDLVPTHTYERSSVNRVIDDQRLVITEVW